MKTLFTSLVLILGFSASAQIDDCCINPDWINPIAMCPFLWDPVVGCNGVEYANSCQAEASGVTSWTNAAGLVNTIDWNCGQTEFGCELDGEIYAYGTMIEQGCNSCYCQEPNIFGGNIVDGYWSCTEMACAGMALCTSYSGVEIFEYGFWTNPSDPCDMGECAPNGEFYDIAIDCPSFFGEPCNGEWVYVRWNVVLYAQKKGRCVLLILALKFTKVAIGRTLTTLVILDIVVKTDSFLASLLIVQNKWACRVMVSGC